MVNLRNIEQISFSFGSFFVANEKGEYSCTKQGKYWLVTGLQGC